MAGEGWRLAISRSHRGLSDVLDICILWRGIEWGDGKILLQYRKYSWTPPTSFLSPPYANQYECCQWHLQKMHQFRAAICGRSLQRIGSLLSITSVGRLADKTLAGITCNRSIADTQASDGAHQLPSGGEPWRRCQHSDLVCSWSSLSRYSLWFNSVRVRV